MARDITTDDINVVSIWRGLRAGLNRLFLVTILAGALAFGIFSSMAPRYNAEVQLSIIAKSTNPFPDASKGANASLNLAPRLDREAVNTHVRLLQAPDLLLRVAEQLKLAERPEFNSALGPVDWLGRMMALLPVGQDDTAGTPEDRVLSVLKSRVEVSVARESRAITVRVTSIEPQLAADIANSIAETYRQTLVDVPVRETTEVVKALEPKIEQLNREVLEADAAAERYRAETDQFRGGSQAESVISQRVASLNSELLRAEAARTDAEAKWRTAKELSAAGIADSLPEVQASRVIQDLIAQRVQVERQVNEARAVLLPAHPRMRPLNEKLEGLRQVIRTEVERVVSSLDKSYRTAEIRVQDLQRQLDELKSRVVRTSGNEAKLKSLENVAKAKRAELERLRKQLEDNRTLAATRSVPIEAQIESRARAATTPIFPLTGKYTLLVMAATLMLGFSVAVTRELLLSAQPAGAVAHNRRATDRAGAIEARPADEEQAVAKQEAKQAPLRANGAANEDLVPEAGEQTGEFSSLEDVAAYLGERVEEDGGFRTLLAGDVAVADIHAEAVEFVIALTEMGASVVVVDWSLDGDGAIETEAASGPGLIDLLAGRVSFEDVVSTLPGTRVHYIAAGTVRSEDEDPLDADGLNLILDALDEAYDHVVVVARYENAQALFEAIEGRFDAGITIEPLDGEVDPEVPDDQFLDFEVAEIELIRYRPAVVETPVQAAKSRRVALVDAV